MFKMTGCPYCRQAFQTMEKLYEKHPEYRKIPIEIIDETENPEISDQYDYYYVPTFYVDGIKMAEGILSEDDIDRVFSAAL